MKYSEMSNAQLCSEIEFLRYEDSRMARGHAEKVKSDLIQAYDIMRSRGFATYNILENSLKTDVFISERN